MTKKQFLERFEIKETQTLENKSSVKEDGANLKFIHNQTEEVCIQAVQQSGYYLKYVHNQTKEMCLEAVKRNGMAFPFV